MSSKEINLAGRTLIVDSIKVLNQSKQTSTSGNVLNATREVLNKKSAGTAQTTANTAQATATSAQTTANTAQATATSAQTTANRAEATAEAVKDLIDEVQFTLSVNPETIRKDLRNEGYQTININTSIIGYEEAEPSITVNGIPLVCAYKSYRGVAGYDLQTLINTYCDNYEFDNNFSGVDAWFRGDAVFDDESSAVVQFIATGGETLSVYCDILSRHTSPDYLHLKVNSRVTAFYGLDNKSITSAQLYIPYRMGMEHKVSLYDGITLMDLVSLDVIDDTEYSKCAGVLYHDASAFPTVSEGVSLIFGDFVVFAENCTFGGVLHESGSLWYINNNNQWVQATSQEKSAEKLTALQALTEADVDLSTLNDKSATKWFSEIVASSVTANYIGSKEIKILSNGTLYGGDYIKNEEGKFVINPNVADPTGFCIDSSGRIEGINAKFRKLTVEKDSTIKGTLQCGNDGDLIIQTVFNNEGDPETSYSYTATHTSTPDGFSWTEAHNYVSARVTAPATTPWNATGADESTLQSLTVQNASGTVNGHAVDKLVYMTSAIATNRMYASQGVNTGGETLNKTVSFTNCMPVPISLNYNFHQGYAFWFAVFNWGAEYPSCQYTVTHTDSTTTTKVLCQNSTSRSQSDFIDTISLLAGETITWAFGHIGAPSVSWNNGVESSTLELSWSLGLSAGLNFYSSGVPYLMPSTGYYDFPANASDNVGLLNLVINNVSIISLPKASASWSYNGVYKYFKFRHQFNGSAVSSVRFYSSFLGCDALYIVDRYGDAHGVSSGPVVSLLNTVAMSAGEFAFSYNGVSYSQIAYDSASSQNTEGYWVRDYYINITLPSMVKGVYTASIYPRDGNSDLGAVGSGKFKALHVITANADVLNAGTTTATSLVTPDISSSSNIQISTIVPKTSTASLGTSSSQFKEVRATEVYENNARVFSTNQIVFSDSYNLTALSIGQIGIFAGTPQVYQSSSNYKAKVTLPSGGTYAYSFIMVGGYDAFRYSGYGSSVAGGTDVDVSKGTSSSNSGNIRVEFKYWRIS